MFPWENSAALFEQLEQALSSDDLVLEYMPIVDLQTEDEQPDRVRLRGFNLVGFEALLRWQHPSGLIMPDDFVALLASNRELSRKVTEWVLKHACWQLSWWQAFYPGLTVSVNLQNFEFEDAGLIEQLATLLKRLCLPPEALKLEMLEHLPGESLGATLSILNSGIGVWVDDIGKGYGSLDRFVSIGQRLPVAIASRFGLKIDRRFMPLFPKTEEAMTCDVLIHLANKYGISTCAEGVEDDKQVWALRIFGCRLAQGFYFGKPASAEYWNRVLKGEEVEHAA